VLQFEHVLTAVDSHTDGEPTRIVTGGLPVLRGTTQAEKRAELGARWDHLRRALIHEPRGHDAIVLAYLTAPADPAADMGVVFANDAGYLGTCGHGSMGVATVLIAQGMVAATEPETRVVLETPVGLVECWVRVEAGRPLGVRIRNVPSFATETAVAITVPGLGPITADIAWGGNWFAFVDAAQVGIQVDYANLDALMAAATAIRSALDAAGVRGHHPGAGEGALVDHVKIWQPLEGTALDGAARGTRDLTLCPGRAYDRSPCGTGTSAKLALLHHLGKLAKGQEFVAESIIRSRFRARITAETTLDGRAAVVPEIEGSAYITGLQQFVLDPSDPFRHGIGS